MDFTNLVWSENTAEILAYLRGKQSPEDNAKFERRLKEDSALRKETKHVRNLIVVLEDPKLVEIESKILKLRALQIQKIKPQKKSVRSRGRHFLPKGKAGIIILIMFGLLLTVSTVAVVGTSANRLYRSNLRPFPSNLPTPEEGSMEPMVETARSFYMEENWEEAALRFSMIADRNSTYKFHYLVSRIMDGSYDDSTNLELLTNFEQSLDPLDPYDEQLRLWVNYYQALILLKQREFSAGKLKLQELSESANVYSTLKDNVDKLNERIAGINFLYW